MLNKVKVKSGIYYTGNPRGNDIKLIAHNYYADTERHKAVTENYCCLLKECDLSNPESCFLLVQYLHIHKKKLKLCHNSRTL